MLRYRCLVLDHDDTVVRSEETVNYPSFCQTLRELRPGREIDLESFTRWCFSPGFEELCCGYFGLSQQELDRQFDAWREYVRTHIPPAFPGIGEVIHRQKQEGGYVCVVSHSVDENIRRDYRTHFGLEPDLIFGWDLGEGRRKPDPYPLDRIMAELDLPPKALLVVDDLKPGYDMAKTRGIDFAFAGWGRTNVPEITAYMEQYCDFSFHTPEELREFLFAEPA